MNTRKHSGRWVALLAIVAVADVIAVKSFEGQWTALIFGGLFFTAIFPIISGLGGCGE